MGNAALVCAKDEKQQHDGSTPATISNSKQLAVVSTTKKPPVQCEGYAPAMLPTFLKPEEMVDFFLSFPDDFTHHETRELACSLIRCMEDLDDDGGGGGDRNNDRDQSTAHVHSSESSFDIDSTKSVIILCHGFMSWRNQMLLAFLAANLSRRLRCHTLRFDFTGNGHSNGPWRYGGYDVEARDLDKVIDFVRHELKCTVSCVIGHSKGAYCALRRAWEQEDLAAADDEQQQQLQRIPCFVNLCGSFYVPHTYSVQNRFTREQLIELETTGTIVLERRGSKVYKVRNDDLEEKRKLNSSRVQVIATSQVLTIHGNADTIVNVASAYKFSETIQPSHHELRIIPGADHAFNGLRHMDELTETIASFVRKWT